MAEAEDLRDRAVRRGIQVQRFNRGLLRRVSERENQALFEVLERRVRKAIEAIRRRGPLERFDRRRTLQDRITAMGRLTRRRLREESDEIIEELVELAKQERDRQEAMLFAVLGFRIKRISDAEIRALVKSQFNGANLQRWLRSAAVQAQDRTQRQIQAGLAQDEDDSAIAARITGPRRSVFSELRLAIGAIVSSATVATISHVQQQAWLNTEGQIDRFMWTAILDDRTCTVCAALDGRVFKVGRGPVPPAHLRCRCTAIPIRKGDEPPDVPTYGDWLRDQPASVQDEVLGVAKARLFRSGRLKLQDFIDSRGSPLSLDEIRARDPDLLSN